MSEEELQRASELMLNFAERTGLTSSEPAKRYLWTDAFALCTFLGLAREMGDERYLRLAFVVAEQVHHVLGKHRGDDGRQGWLSGLGDREGAAHPTLGGLRIGKPLPERGPDEPFDERREWDRDGQYFHYSTRWMHALDQLGRASADPCFNVWARELAQAARAFVYEPPGGSRPYMYWKMSIDLSRPLVRSMGPHDPLDGYLTSLQLEATARVLSAQGEPALDHDVRRFAALLEGVEWASTDPLALGGLLVGLHRAQQLEQWGVALAPGLWTRLLEAATAGLEGLTELRGASTERLAFRELGLAIGLCAARLARESWRQRPPASAEAERQAEQLEALGRFAEWEADIVQFWSAPEHQQDSAWSAHQDINEVMLATALVPSGYLTLSAPPAMSRAPAHAEPEPVGA